MIVTLVVVAACVALLLVLAVRGSRKQMPADVDTKTLVEAEAEVKRGTSVLPSDLDFVKYDDVNPKPEEAVINTPVVTPKPAKKAPAKKAAPKKTAKSKKPVPTQLPYPPQPTYAPDGYGYPLGTYWNPNYSLWFFGSYPLDENDYTPLPGPGEDGWANDNSPGDFTPDVQVEQPIYIPETTPEPAPEPAYEPAPTYDAPTYEAPTYEAPSYDSSSSSSYDSGSSSSYDSGSSSSYDSGSSDSGSSGGGDW